MILAAAVILGVVASLIRHRGQTARQIASIPLRSTWLALLALALQVPLLRAPSGPTKPLGVQQSLFLLSHLLLIAFVWRNRQLTGIQILGLGIFCNILVTTANDGFMPITPETLVRINPGSTWDQWPLGYHYGGSKDIILPRVRTDLWLLSDILILPPPFPWPTAFSLGDILIGIGIVVLLQGPAKRSQKGTTGTQPSRGNATPGGARGVFTKKGRNETMKHKSLNQLLCAATINVRFREALLNDPAEAITAGYFDHTFSLTSEEQDLVLGIRADRLEDFAAQVYQWISGGSDAHDYSGKIHSYNGNGRNGHKTHGNGHHHAQSLANDSLVDLFRAPALAPA